MGEIKLGAGKIGNIYLGDTQLLRFDITKLFKTINIASDFVGNVGCYKLLIANLSDSEDLILHRENIITPIPKQHIEWYNINPINEEYSLRNEGNSTVRYISTLYTVDDNGSHNSFKNLYANGKSNLIESFWYGDIPISGFFHVIIIFNEI